MTCSGLELQVQVADRGAAAEGGVRVDARPARAQCERHHLRRAGPPHQHQTAGAALHGAGGRQLPQQREALTNCINVHKRHQQTVIYNAINVNDV